MTTKRYLEQIGRIEKIIKNKQLEFEKLRELCGNRGVSYDRERVQTSNISDTTGRMGTELVSISNQIDRWLKKRDEIIRQIDSIEDVECYEVLTYRYVQQMSIFEIMEQMDRRESQVYRSIKKACETFEEKFGEMYPDDNNRQ